MHETIQKALNDQANHEVFAALSYQAMAYWCAERDYNGFAEFFAKQAAEERVHADKFFQHLLDRDVKPEVSAVAAPANDFSGLPEVAAAAEKLERINTEKIKECYKAAIACEDFESYPLLLWFLEEQVEEEAWTHTMVTLSRRAECSGAIYGLDRHIIKELAADE
jgi:ferritin